MHGAMPRPAVPAPRRQGWAAQMSSTTLIVCVSVRAGGRAGVLACWRACWRAGVLAGVLANAVEDAVVGVV